MGFCNQCKEDVETDHDQVTGLASCTKCGNVLDESSWSLEPTFTKEGGESTVAGHFVSTNAATHGLGRISNGRAYGFQLGSQEKAAQKARYEIERLIDVLGIKPREDISTASQRLYKVAMQHNFTRGRRTAHIAAACIYIILRQENQPFMLLDFSDALQVNVFVLGSVFLQLCRILRLEEHAMLQRPVDPSLFLHRFANRMGFGSKMTEVANTALRLVSSMKRDWLQTGRRPAGVCGAALFIAGHIHGFEKTKADIVRVVHVGEATLAKRLSEFTHTSAGELTVDEFEVMDKRLAIQQDRSLDAMQPLALPVPDSDGSGCEHLKMGVALFAHGMCRQCYVDYLQVTSGHAQDGADPPAFTQGAKDQNKQRLLEHEERPALPYFATEEGAYVGSLADDFEAALAEEGLGSLAKALVPAHLQQQASDSGLATEETGPSRRATRSTRKRGRAAEDEEPESSAGNGEGPSASRRTKSGNTGNVEAAGGSGVGSEGVSPDRGDVTMEEEHNPLALQIVPQPEEDAAEPEISDTLSDLSDDEEVVGYINTPEEANLKGIIWTALNKDYIEAQAIKEAKSQPAKVDAPAEGEEQGDGQQPSEKTDKKARGRPKGSKSKPRPEDQLGPAASPQDGLRKMLTAKKLSSKINYDNLNTLFDGPTPGTSGEAGRRKSASAAVEPSSRINREALEQAIKSAPAAGEAAKKPPRKRRAAAPKAPELVSEPAPKPPPKPALATSSAKVPKMRASALGSLKTGMAMTRSSKAPLPASIL